jgi:flagellin-like hook-associated protein FlgL
MLGGCETSGNPQLAVNIPADCERNAQTVSQPAMKVGDDAMSALARTRAALGLANRRLESVAECEARMRARFAKGG